MIRKKLYEHRLSLHSEKLLSEKLNTKADASKQYKTKLHQPNKKYCKYMKLTAFSIFKINLVLFLVFLGFSLCS